MYSILTSLSDRIYHFVSRGSLQINQHLRGQMYFVGFCVQRPDNARPRVKRSRLIYRGSPQQQGAYCTELQGPAPRRVNRAFKLSVLPGESRAERATILTPNFWSVFQGLRPLCSRSCTSCSARNALPANPRGDRKLCATSSKFPHVASKSRVASKNISKLFGISWEFRSNS